MARCEFCKYGYIAGDEILCNEPKGDMAGDCEQYELDDFFLEEED